MSNELKITKLKLERVSRGITQVALSVSARIPQPYLSRYESGIWIPREEDRIKLAKALGVPLKKIFPPNERKYA